MKVLVAIEDKYDAVALVESILNRSWPTSTSFTLVHVVEADNRLTQPGELAGDCGTLDREAQSAYRLLLETKAQLQKHFRDAYIEIIVCAGEPTEEILDSIYRARPEVLVIGKHCRNRLLRVFHTDVGMRLLNLIPSGIDAVHVVEVAPVKRRTTARSTKPRREKCRP